MPCFLLQAPYDEDEEDGVGAELEEEGLVRDDAEYESDRFVMDSLEAMGSRSAELAMEVQFKYPGAKRQA